MVKNPPTMQETWVQSLDWEDSPGGRHDNLLPYSCLENSHEQRNLKGYSQWGRKESDTTDQLSTAHKGLIHEKSESEVLSRVRLLATPWTAAYQAPPSLGFSKQEHWSG